MIRSTFSGFSTALSALQANQMRLDITGQNLSNMNTQGYTRQQLDVSSLNSAYPRAYYNSNPIASVGYGVRMDGVSQIRDPFLDTQYRLQMTKSGYTDSLQTAYDSLANVLDESEISGIRQAFDNIQSTLLSLQDISKINDPIYENELRTRMQALTNLLNQSAKQITKLEQQEYSRLDGAGTSENGAVQNVNEILQKIGELNRQIKRNEIVGQSALELKDERNLLLDELSSYIPIEVSYFKDEQHDGLDSQGNAGTDEGNREIYEYDSKGNIVGKRDWPDDLRVELVYQDANGDTQRITLVDGTEGTGNKNYGSLSIAQTNGDPTTASITFKPAETAGTTSVSIEAGGDAYLSEGSIQGSLDMLGKDGVSTGQTDVRGYQYYMDQLDALAETFATTINGINGSHTAGGGAALLKGDANGITAESIGITDEWLNGTVGIGKDVGDVNTGVIEMYEAMFKTYTELDDNSFADFMNHVSTTLANDSYNNQLALQTDVTVLNGIQNSRDSLSGVSLDEEAANMMTFISAYNAASRLMTTLDQALDTLINNTGVVGR